MPELLSSYAPILIFLALAIGLGLHLIKQMVDSLSYEYANRRSTVTFTRTVDDDV